MKNPEVRRITKRLVVSVLGGIGVYLFMMAHRDWVWVYFQSVMDSPREIQPELMKIAEKSIDAITTIAIWGMSIIGSIVTFFVTGNVVAMTSMYKHVIGAQTNVSSANTTVSTLTHSIQEEIKAAEKKFAGDPSYRPPESLPDRDVEEFR